jgi:hypothetical protein
MSALNDGLLINDVFLNNDGPLHDGLALMLMLQKL